jgi:hypothetical protein
MERECTRWGGIENIKGAFFCQMKGMGLEGRVLPAEVIPKALVFQGTASFHWF